MAAAPKEVRFLAVARRSDKVILAHRIHTLDKSYDFIANVQKVRGVRAWCREIARRCTPVGSPAARP